MSCHALLRSGSALIHHPRQGMVAPSGKTVRGRRVVNLHYSINLIEDFSIQPKTVGSDVPVTKPSKLVALCASHASL